MRLEKEKNDSDGWKRMSVSVPRFDASAFAGYFAALLAHFYYYYYYY